MLAVSAEAAHHQIQLQADLGALMFQSWTEPRDDLKTNLAALLGTVAPNISYMKNASEGLGLIAAGYPLSKGDQILTYVHEYPANYYPWRLQEARGAELVLIQNVTYSSLCGGKDLEGPCGFRIEEIEKSITPRTRIIALSHVQFTSGFACDLESLAKICRERGIDLVLDCAQSLGSLPIYPDELGVAAICSSGWKWLMGPVGTGIMYTSPAFREKIEIKMAGADLMRQGMDYLDHSWNPHSDGRKFEYSTHDFIGCAALAASCAAASAIGIETIARKIQSLHAVFLENLDRSHFHPLVFSEKNRSGILSLRPVSMNAEAVGKSMAAEGFVVSPRAGFVRVAPHYTNDREQMIQAAYAMNRIASAG